MFLNFFLDILKVKKGFLMKIVFTILFISFAYTNIIPQNLTKAVLFNHSTNKTVIELNKSDLKGYDRLKLKAFLFHDSKIDFPQMLILNKRFNNVNLFPKNNTDKIKLEDGYYLINETYQTWGDTNWINVTNYIYNFDNNKRLTATIFQTWDGVTWINSTRNQDFYNDNNNLAEELIQEWSGSDWIDKDRYTYIYDENNKQAEALWEYWNGFDWVSNGEYLYTYDDNSNLLEERFQVWSIDHWENNLLSTYTYENNNVTSLTNEEWADSIWLNTTRFIYEYDANDNQSVIIDQIWEDSIWVYNSKYTKVYDANKNVIEMTYQFWNTDWINSQYYKYNYDNNDNLKDQVTQVWNGVSWDNKSKSLYTYNNNYLSNQLDQSWNGTNWMDIAKTFNAYDEHNNLIENYYVTWDDTTWVNNYKNIYEYSTLTSIDKNLSDLNEFKLFNNYPNPFNPSTTLSWQTPIGGFQIIKIFDLLGSEVATLVNEYRPAGSYRIKFNLEEKLKNAASGVYFFQIRIDGSDINQKNSGRLFVQTKKMVYLK